MTIKKVYNLLVINKIKFSLLLVVLITFVFVTTSFPSNVFAGGGPQFVCKGMAQKQGWLIDNTRYFEELSPNSCILRNSSEQEKDEILNFCNAETDGDTKANCLDKCSRYYRDNTFNKCKLNQVASYYVYNSKNLLKTQMTLQQAIIVSFVVVIISYIAVTLLKRNKKSKTEKDN